MKFKIEVDLSKEDQTNALNALFRAIGGQSAQSVLIASVEDTKPVPEEKPKKKRASRAKTVEAEKEAVTENKEDAQTEMESNEGASSTEEIETTFVEVRALFTDKLQDADEGKRKKYIAELKRLGATNLPGLKEKHWADFMAFLNKA